ncbi:VWA domain-containing protein [Archaeoglobus sp.]|uniref:vWA domain-containing protein n=1 Tax=Archaeoglobus sp. TaxID=1872626 RepID=UPI0025C3BAB9|nr:VWA domain-containing protein [Archaeoglobus sp.]
MSVDKKGVSLLLEYLFLAAILSVFVVVLGLSIHDVLTEAQVLRVAENQFADVASQISAYYTDYILLRPPSGYIKTKISLLPEVGDYEYKVRFEERGDRIFISLESVTGDIKAQSGLGLDKFVLPEGGKLEIKTSGEVLSAEAEGEEKPEITYTREEACPFELKPRLDFIPSSVEKGGETQLVVFFENSNEITEPVSWNVTFWNGTVIEGSGKSEIIELNISDITGCQNIGGYDYECRAEIFAWIEEKETCNASSAESLLVSEKPIQSNPYITYNKWVEPKTVSPGETFEVHLKLEGRGFVNQAINLSAVHVVDVSGSMDWDAIYKEFNQTIVPNVVRRVVNTTDFSTNPGNLEIYAYTTDKLSDWYYDLSCFSSCDSCSPPPWNGKGIDSSFVKLYVNGAEVGTDYTDGEKVGKQYVNTNAKGSYTIEVTARAPEQINLTILVKFNGSIILNENISYSNYQEFSFELPADVDFSYLKISNFQGSMPYWYIDRNCWWSWLSGWTCDYDCTYKDNHNDPNVLLNVWVVEPSGNKEFARDIDRDYSYDIKYRYENNNPPEGTFKIIVVPTSKESETFKATVYLKRIEAAQLAAIQFNNMLGDGDFVGLTKFSDDASRVEVNSSPLKYMTKDKDHVNDLIRSLAPNGATDHADALYYGVKVFPIWNEPGNNCTDCINNTRPLMILLTDGETTECDVKNYFGCDLCDGSCDGSDWCQSGANQALCVANYIKNNLEINGFEIPICTIGFGTSLTSNGQELLKDIASPRPDNNEPCYFFATTSEELLEAYKTIFNIFQIAAKNISINESLNVTLSGPFEFVSATATSSKGNPVDLQVDKLPSSTVIKLNMASIQKDETIELTVRLKVKEDAQEGTYDINNEGFDISYIDFTPLNYLGQETTTCPAGSTWTNGKCRMEIVSDKDKLVVTTGEGGEITLG